MGYYPMGVPADDQDNMGMGNGLPNCLFMGSQAPNPEMVRTYHGTPGSSSPSSAISFDSVNYGNNNGYGDFSAPSGSNVFSGPNVFSAPNGPGYFYGSNVPSDFYGTNGTNNFYGDNGINGFGGNNGHNVFYGPNSLNSFHSPNGYTGFNGHNNLVMPFDSFTASSYGFPNLQQVTPVQQIVLEQQLAVGYTQAAASTSSGLTTSERSSSEGSTNNTSTRTTRSSTKRHNNSSPERGIKRRRVSTPEQSEDYLSPAITQQSEANTDRADVACNRCKNRKVKCELEDQDAEGCKACLRRGQPCIFFDRVTGRNLPRQYLRTIEHHYTSLINYTIEMQDYLTQHGLGRQLPEALQDSLAFFNHHGIGRRNMQNQQAEQNPQAQSQ